MNDVVILNMKKKKRLFSSKPDLERIAEYEVFSANPKVSSLKYVTKYSGGRPIIVDDEALRSAKLEKYIKQYKEYNFEAYLSVIEKIVLSVAGKYNVKPPFSEVFISESPYNAAKIIEKIKGLSGLFTVISDDYSTDAFDELYFKHGIVIRQLPEFIFKNKEKSIIIKGSSGGEFFDCGQIPIIDLSSEENNGMSIAVSKLCVYDESIKGFLKCMNIIPSLRLYTLLGIVPGENSAININKTADNIFLLDTKKVSGYN